jgi:hypothetical protein
MKKLLIIVFIVFMAVPFALNADAKTLVPENFESGGYGGPAFKFTTIDGQFSFLMGGGGAWLINHRISIGGMGFGLTSDLSSGGRDIDMSYGGFNGGYVFFPDSVVHFTAHATIGWGEVSLTGPAESDNFLVIEPSLDAEVNLVTWVRLCAGVSYRIVSGVSGITGINNSDLSGLAGTIFIKFGLF